MNDFNDNITFFLEEKSDDKDNESEIQNMMYEFTRLSESEVKQTQEMDEFLLSDDGLGMEYFLQKGNYGNDELFYEQEYTVKDLLKICSYYGLDKDIRTSKCKKQDIIATIVYFESLPKNFDIVHKRNRMWGYIMELMNDPKMKKYIIF